MIPSFAALFQITLSIIFAVMLSRVMAGVLIFEVVVILLVVWFYSSLQARLSLDRLIAEERLGKGAQLYMRAAIAIWFGRIGSPWFRRRLGEPWRSLGLFFATRIARRAGSTEKREGAVARPVP